MRRRKLLPTIKQIMLRSTLDSQEKLIMIAIHLHSDREGWAKVPVRGQLDVDTGLSEATIKARIRRLVAQGVLLKNSDGARTANRYHTVPVAGIFKDYVQG